MLQLRPNCEWCDVDLPGDSAAAFVCSFECTFCRDCATRTLQGRCPNCDGELLARPRRPSRKLATHPASTQRVVKSGGPVPRASPAGAVPAHFLMFYEFVADYLARRGGFRDAHLRLAWAAQARGELMLGGAYAEPADGAVLLFRGESAAVAERFARQDPYVQAGLVVRWSVRRWTTVVGTTASTPVRPVED